MKNIVFTLCSNNYLAHAKTLGDSVRNTNPDFHFIIGLVDKRDPKIDYSFFKDFEIIDYDAIGFPVFEEMVPRYNVIEFNTAVKPFYFEYLLSRQGVGAKIFYLDPDIVLYAGLDRLVSILESSNIVLTPMLTVANANVTTDELVALRHGLYNLGFIGLKFSDETFLFVRWWQERLKRHCVIDKPRGLFVDQKWVDLAPLFFKGICVFPDPCYNMAWWNFAERKLLISGGNYHVNNIDSLLVFFHFSGYKVGSTYFTGRVNHIQYSLEARPDLAEIFKDYSSRLEENMFRKFEILEPLLRFAPLKKEKKGAIARINSKLKSFIRKVKH